MSDHNSLDPLARLDDLGITLPEAPKPLAAYVPAVITDPSSRTLIVSGQLPTRDGELIAQGTVPDEVSVELAQACAQQCAVNALAVAAATLGSLDRIARVLRIGGFVAATPAFTQHPAVINGASLFIGEVFGESGIHARAAVGVSSLPLGAPVEIEFAFEVR